MAGIVGVHLEPAGDSKANDENGASINGDDPFVWYDYPEPAAAEKTGQQAYDAIQGVVDQLNKAFWVST